MLLSESVISGVIVRHSAPKAKNKDSLINGRPPCVDQGHHFTLHPLASRPLLRPAFEVTIVAAKDLGIAKRRTEPHAVLFGCRNSITAPTPAHSPKSTIYDVLSGPTVTLLYLNRADHGRQDQVLPTSSAEIQ